ncbi:hypothetical protein [Brachybacterium sp. AOP35-5H-19]|uniref:hypothetical protein n=1 Tax=Brachybacterium sp. AOP35-5H-19 TaxID=3457685 RepID=UPI004034E2BA
MTDALKAQRRMAAQIRQAISSGTICGKCHQIPDDCSCPNSSAAQTADPLRDPAWWAQREDLLALYSYAHQQGASPAAVLNAAIMMTLARTPSNVALPGIRGGRRGSLNLFGALVGKSGAGKGAATDAAEDGIIFHGGSDYTVGQGGSGEGLIGKFGHIEVDKETKEKRVFRDADAVLLDIAEISGLGAQMSRSGSTLSDQILKAFSGSRLGFGYAGANGFEIDRHSYRLTMIAGVQPENSGILLGQDGSGLPQRFIWAHAAAPDAPDFDPKAIAPDPVHVHLPHWDYGEYIVSMDEPVLLKIGQNSRELAKDSGLGLDGHAMFSRVKVAAALTFMRGAKHITEEDWQMSSGVMAHSDHARQYCVGVLESLQSEENRRRGRARDEVDAAADLERDTRIRNNLVRYWKQNPGATAPALVRMLAGRDRKDGQAVAEQLAAENSAFPAYSAAA